MGRLAQSRTVIHDHSLRGCYFVVETGSWLNSRRVLLATHRLTPVPTAQWLTIDASRDEVRNSPRFSTNLTGSRKQEQALADHFHTPSASGGIPDAAAVLSYIRAKGIGNVDSVEAVVLEADGSMNVIGRSADHSLLQDVKNYPPESELKAW